MELPIINFDKLIDGEGFDRLRRTRHGELFPDHVRCIIAGPSGCGKTNVLFNILFNGNGVRFTNVYAFCKSLFQPKYQFLKNTLESVPEIGYFPASNNDDIIPPDQVLPNSVMIFDDVACEKQNNVAQYFAMGRHSDVDIFYLIQTYSKVPKQLVRDNTNFLILFRQDLLNLQHIYRDHVGPDMTFEAFQYLCNEAWQEPNGFLTIDKENPKRRKRYRAGLDG